jgi:hypothetical protein
MEKLSLYLLQDDWVCLCSAQGTTLPEALFALRSDVRKMCLPRGEKRVAVSLLSNILSTEDDIRDAVSQFNTLMAGVLSFELRGFVERVLVPGASQSVEMDHPPRDPSDTEDVTDYFVSDCRVEEDVPTGPQTPMANFTAMFQLPECCTQGLELESSWTQVGTTSNSSDTGSASALPTPQTQTCASGIRESTVFRRTMAELSTLGAIPPPGPETYRLVRTELRMYREATIVALELVNRLLVAGGHRFDQVLTITQHGRQESLVHRATFVQDGVSGMAPGKKAAIANACHNLLYDSLVRRVTATGDNGLLNRALFLQYLQRTSLVCSPCELRLIVAFIVGESAGCVGPTIFRRVVELGIAARGSDLRDIFRSLVRDQILRQDDEGRFFVR